MKRDISEIIHFFDKPPELSVNNVELSVGFFLAPSFTLYAFAGFSDVLRHAADEANFSRQIYCRWNVLGLDDKPIRSSCGIDVLPHRQDLKR